MENRELKIGYGNLKSIPFGGWILRFYPVFQEFVEKIENRGKDGSMNSQNLPRFFLKFTDRMENRGKGGI